jgi:hypothetical protein
MINDFRFAFRQLRKSPGFTTVAILTLALGMGATTSIFSVVSAVLLRPLPFPNNDLLVRIGGRSLVLQHAQPRRTETDHRR